MRARVAPLPLDESAEDSAPKPLTGSASWPHEGLYVDLYRRVRSVPGVAMGLGNVYGPRQDPKGEAGVVAMDCGKAA